MPNALAVVKDIVRVSRKGTRPLVAQTTEITASQGGVAPLTLTHGAPAGIDSAPMPGDYVYLGDTDGTGRGRVINYVDPLKVDVTLPGEIALYSRYADTKLISGFVFLRNDGAMFGINIAGGNQWRLDADGRVLISNAAGSITIEVNGDVNINGAIISAAGEITNAAGIVLGTHTHDEGSHAVGVQPFTTDGPN